MKCIVGVKYAWSELKPGAHVIKALGTQFRKSVHRKMSVIRVKKISLKMFP
jgi:hypothetical protein